MSGNAARAQSILRGIKILLVDDEEDPRELMAVLLRDFGGEVMTAESASEGFDTFASFRPDALVSDIGMPGEDGYSFMRRIRAFEAKGGAATPSLALTAFTSAEHRAMAIAAGFDRHVGKPADLDSLASMIVDLVAVQRR